MKFRCLMAGGSAEIFESDTRDLIHAATKGVPRDINRLAHGALFRAARRGKKTVDTELIKSLTNL